VLARAFFFAFDMQVMGTITPSFPTAIRWYEFGIVKAEPSDDAAAPWIIYIQASSPRVDFDNEWVPQEALKQAAAYFLENGKVSYEHVTAENRHDASVIIGEPMAVKFPADGTTLVQARLYPLQPQARYVWNILQSGGKLKASIGGSCAKRPARDGTTEIPQIFWNHLAITSWPVNDDTLVSLQPFSAFVKALGTTSATPLVMEDLQGAKQALTPALRQRWQALTETLAEQYPTLTLRQAQSMALLLMTRRGETRQAYAPSTHLMQESPYGRADAHAAKSAQ
jgi:hypothetical protein